MAKVKSDGHIWGLELNRYVCFSFRGNWTIFGWDIANSMFDLENSKSRSWPRSNLMVTFEAQSSIEMFAFCFVAIRLVQKHKVTPGIPEWLNYALFSKGTRGCKNNDDTGIINNYASSVSHMFPEPHFENAWRKPFYQIYTNVSFNVWARHFAWNQWCPWYWTYNILPLHWKVCISYRDQIY